MNKYKLLLCIIVSIPFIGLFSLIEYQLFSTSVIGAIIGNTFIATLFFLMYKSNKLDAQQKGDEQ